MGKSTFISGGPFNINESTGLLTTNATLDRESQSSYNIEVTINDHGIPALTASSVYKIIVGDVNDNDPVFTQMEYVVTIVENIPVESLILLPKATDADEGDNAKVTYSLSSQSGVHRYFNIDAGSGVVTVQQPISRSFYYPSI